MALLENLKDKHIILASKSPRRQHLLKGLEIDFEIRTRDVEESYPDQLQREEVPRYLSELKASAFKEELKENELLITSDTTVYLNNGILNKPEDAADAKRMLRKLSGNMHTVLTGVTLTSQVKQVTFHDETNVYFTELTDDEIDYYLQTCKPFDKAGAYGIQELMGYIGIEKIEGSFFNVMGLPLQKLYAELKVF